MSYAMKWEPGNELTRASVIDKLDCMNSQMNSISVWLSSINAPAKQKDLALEIWSRLYDLEKQLKGI